MDVPVDLLPHLVNGISLGLLFALIALGFMLILGVMEVINLAHGSLFALGAYLALTLLAPKFGVSGDSFAWYTRLAHARALRVGVADRAAACRCVRAC